jgi:divalent metal cation (Fe/Co/Zn/Cd) transporter
LVAVRHAMSPADREHRFGHGKAESLAGLGQSVFIGGSAVFLPDSLVESEPLAGSPPLMHFTLCTENHKSNINAKLALSYV